ncbi:MAG: helix-turn-helix domain-containing protein, partial [Butyricicoccus sp.]|nr:helix-turn-helix domain-containing protein [Butyricicoccus sp.]
MTTGDKIAKLRRENNYTQEQLADIFGVSRQSISKWESGAAYPEVDKLIRMGELFGCTMDYLLKDEITEPSAVSPPPAAPPHGTNDILTSSLRIRERTSEHRLWGMPLWQVGKNARAVVAVGVNARGIVAVGIKSFGLISVGMLSFGLLSFGLVAIGLLACGCVAVGALAAGSVALGVVAA